MIYLYKSKKIHMFPKLRLRRLRKDSYIRDLVAETNLSTSDLIYPIFIIEGFNKRQEIKSLPNVARLSIDLAIKEIAEACKLGIKAIALFPCVDQSLKDEKAIEAYNIDNLICRAIREIKKHNLNITIIADVALDPYTSHGHDGIIENLDVHNDKTIEALKMQSLTLAKAGADIIAPSDMMDGRIGEIRGYLDKENFENITILSYSAKYASSLYNPFRDAVGSNLIGNKKTYQMDYRNAKEALREIALDINEGADLIMIKPAITNLDIIYRASSNFDIPIFAYQVSGEYAMLKAASNQGFLIWQDSIIESLTTIKRAGANAIFSYAALEVALHLKG